MERVIADKWWEEINAGAGTLLDVAFKCPCCGEDGVITTFIASDDVEIICESNFELDVKCERCNYKLTVECQREYLVGCTDGL